MTSSPAWQFDEFHQVGVDYADPAEVARYEARHRKYRDIDRDNATILDRLKLQGHEILLDMGTGAGNLVLQAAPHCRLAIGVDVSEAMLAYARQKAEAARVYNAEFRHGGFLTYRHY